MKSLMENTLFIVFLTLFAGSLHCAGTTQFTPNSFSLGVVWGFLSLCAQRTALYMQKDTWGTYRGLTLKGSLYLAAMLPGWLLATATCLTVSWPSPDPSIQAVLSNFVLGILWVVVESAVLLTWGQCPGSHIFRVLPD